MAGPSGFMQRWQGKVLAKLLGVGNQGMQVYGGLSAASYTNGIIPVGPNALGSLEHQGTLNGTATTVALAILPYGITKLSSVGGSTYALGAPIPRRRAWIYTDAIGDGARKINASPATFLSTLAGASVLNLSTTVVQSVELIALSTSQWLLASNVGSISVSTS